VKGEKDEKAVMQKEQYTSSASLEKAIGAASERSLECRMAVLLNRVEVTAKLTNERRRNR
jgi:hypothetical protein